MKLSYLISILLLLGNFAEGYSQEKVEIVAQKGQGGKVSESVFSPSEQFFLTYNADKIVFWELKSGLQYGEIQSSEKITAVKFLSDSVIALGSSKGLVQVWNFKGMKLLNEIRLNETIKDLQLNVESQQLLIASDKLYQIDKSFQSSQTILDTAVFKIHYNKKTESYWVLATTGLAHSFSKDMAHLKSVQIKRPRKYVSKHNYFHFLEAKRFAFIDEFNMVVMAISDGIKIFDLDKERFVFQEGSYYYGDEFTSVDVHENLNKIIASTEGGLIYHYNINKSPRGQNTYSHHVQSSHIADVNDLTFSPSGNYFVSSSDDYSAVLFHSSSTEEIQKFYSKTFSISAITFNGNTSFIAGDDIGALHLYHLGFAEKQAEHQRVSLRTINSISHLSDSSLLVAADRNLMLTHRWGNDYSYADRGNGKFSKKIEKIEDGASYGIYFNPEISASGKYITYGYEIKLNHPLITDYDRKERVKFLTYGENQKYAKQLSKKVQQSVFSPDEQYLFIVNTYSSDWVDVEKIELQGQGSLFKKSGDDFVFVKLVNKCDTNNIIFAKWADNENIIAQYEEGQLCRINCLSGKVDTLNKSISSFDVYLDERLLIFSKYDTLFIEDLRNGARKYEINNGCPITSFDLNLEEDIVAIGGNDGAAKIWSISENKLIAQYLTVNMTHHVIITSDNYYLADPVGLHGIGFKVGEQLYPSEQFDLKYNRPDIVLQTIGVKDSNLIAAYRLAYQKRLKKMGFTEDMLKSDFHLPTAEIQNSGDIPTQTDSAIISLQLLLEDTKYDLDRINIWLNDVAIYGTNGISIRDLKTKSYEMDLPLELAFGRNKVQVSVLNTAGAESYKETFEIECSSGKNTPDLYIATIGVSKYEDERYNLTYAAKDAEDMVTAFQGSSFFENVYHKTLTDEEVVIENLASLSNFLQQADINDQVILFVAGHGVLDFNFDYYFASHNMDFQDPAKNGIPYEKLESLLDGIKPIKKLLFMDTCHSGEVDRDEIQFSSNTEEKDGDDQIVFRSVGSGVEQKENSLGLHNTTEIMKSMFTDLRKGTGSTVISSAGGVEFAMESTDWKNGLFTYCLISGITEGGADLNGDKEVSISELQQYVQDQVSSLSGGRQTPTSRIENNTLDYRIW